MPRDDKDWKRLIRERMSRTGETYSTARANLLVEQPVEAKSLPEVRDLLALAHDLPSSITRLHVKTEQIWGRGALAIGEEQQRALGRVSVPRGEKGRPRWHGETWMELDSRSWLDAMRTVLPVRWREEGVGERRRAAMLSGTYASNGAVHWSDTEHGLVSRPLDRRGATRPANGSWVCDTSWASVPGSIEIEDLCERVGRQVATVVLIPLGYEPFREPNRIPGPLDQGDQHRFAIDLETGLALKRTSYYKGEVILEREVLELDFPEFFDDSLFEPPSGREVQEIEGPRQYRDLDELLRAAPFRLLLPRLPERFRFLVGHVSPGPGDALRVVLIFHAGPGESVVLNEVRDEVPDDMIPIAWERVERAGRVVEVSSLDPTVSVHDVRVAVDGIRARVVLSSLPLEDLVEVALSLHSVEGSGGGGG